MRQGMSGLSISHGPVNGITAVVLYKGLIRMYLFVRSGPLRNWPRQPCRDFVRWVLLCPWLLTSAHVWGEKETWNLDFKVLLSRNWTKKLLFSVFISACLYQLCQFRSHLLFGGTIVTLLYDNQDWVSDSVLHQHGEQACVLIYFLSSIRQMQSAYRWVLRPTPIPVGPHAACAIFHFPLLITDRAVDLVLLVHVQEQMCWLCRA